MIVTVISQISFPFPCPPLPTQHVSSQSCPLPPHAVVVRPPRAGGAGGAGGRRGAGGRGGRALLRGEGRGGRRKETRGAIQENKKDFSKKKKNAELFFF